MDDFTVKIHKDKTLTFKVPYNSEFITRFKNIVSANDRDFDRHDKTWLVTSPGYLERVVDLIESVFEEEVDLI